MKVHHCKHSKRSAFVSIIILTVISMISFLVMSCSKEEKGEKLDDLKNSATSDTSKTLQPVNEDKSKIIIFITKEGDVLIQNQKIELNSIQRRIEDFRNEYPDGNVIITSGRDSFNEKTLEEVLDQVRAAKAKAVVVSAIKEE